MLCKKITIVCCEIRKRELYSRTMCKIERF